MKLSVLKLAAVICAAALAGGCGLFSGNDIKDESEIMSETKQQESQNNYTVVEKDRFSFEVADNWQLKEQDGQEYYSDVLTGAVYRCAVSPDNGKEPEQNIKDILDLFSVQSAELYENLSDVTSNSDGEEIRTSVIKMKQNGYDTFVYLVFCKERNLIVMYTGQFTSDLGVDDYVLEKLRYMAMSSRFKDTEDKLSNGSFEEDHTGITFEFSDGSFELYMNADGSEGDHISGKCEILRGMEAVERVNSMEEYGLTAEEQLGILKSRGSFFDDYYAVILNIEQSVKDGENTVDEPVQKLYVGNYIEETDSFDMTNCNSFYNAQWQRK